MGVMSDNNPKDDSLPPSYPRYPSQHRTLIDDEDTLYRDDDSYMSEAESILSATSSVWYSKPRMTGRQSRPPVQTGDKETQKHVLEYWKLAVVPPRTEITGGKKVLGVNIQEWDHYEGSVTKVGVAKNQSELSEIYQSAVASYEGKARRSWPARVVRGKAKSYEQDLEKRCDRLPLEVKDSIEELLEDRAAYTSSLYRRREWTVVHMEERSIHRFTRTQGAKVRRHKLRFWKKAKPQLSEFHIIIRGAETGQAEAENGYTTPGEFTNPWSDFDDEERQVRRQERLRNRSRDNRSRARSFSRSISRPRERSRYRRSDVESSPPRERRPLPRSPSPDSYMDEGNYSWRQRDDDEYDDYTPREPNFRSRPRVFSPVPVYNGLGSRQFPAAPTPPESFTPPPGVSQFRTIPRFPPPPPPPPAGMFNENPFAPARYPNPFHSAGPFPPWNNDQVPPPPPTEFPSFYGFGNTSPYRPPPPPPPPPGPRFKAFCPACKSTPDCGHFPGTTCFRPIIHNGYPSYQDRHPDCLVCRDPLRPRSPSQPFGYGQPTAYTFTNRANIPPLWSRPPPPPPQPMCVDPYDYEDGATVMDDDDEVASQRTGEDNEVKEDEQKDEDDEDTQVEELFEAAGNEPKGV
ncbi:hypothetical protein V8F20_003528 [Naviculisporaceae sp. PSN 640]